MSNRLFVGNLTFNTTDGDLHRAFADHGDVAEVKIVMDRETGRSRGFAFVEMATAEGARKATEALNGASLDGRALRVSEAEERRGGGGGGGGGFGGGGGGGGGGGYSGSSHDRGGGRNKTGGGGGGSRGGGRW